MTPAERDEVRKQVGLPCIPTCTAHGGCRVARAVQCYVPPGDTDPVALYPMVAVTVEGREIVVVVRGEEVIADAAHMRVVAHTLHAASDVAEAAQ